MPHAKQGVIRIAVTGHRSIDNNHELTASIQKVFDQIIRDHPKADYQLLSALAEGSDQLVARIARQNALIQLIVPLPLPKELYLLHFETEEGRLILDQLLENADQIITLNQDSDPESAYDNLASYLIDRCTVLIALWNGEYSGRRGGTGEVVKEALNAGKPVYWIYSDNLQDGALNSLKELKKSGEIQVLGKNRDIKIDKYSPV
jgi:hypothetical protein